MNMQRALAASIGVADKRAWSTGGVWYRVCATVNEMNSLNFYSWPPKTSCHISISSASHSLINQSAIIVDCKRHGRRARHKSYALWLATCYNKRWLCAHTTQLSSDRFNYRIGQTFVELVWTTTCKRFSKSETGVHYTTFARKSANHPTFGC